jgi:hypothetical protein
MLNPEKYKQSALKEGLVLRVAKSAETILKYVCKSSNFAVTARDNKSATPVFNDYIYHAYNKGLINDKLKSKFEQIRNIRNTSAHHDGAETFNLEHDELSIHEAEVIEDALTYITDWFFHTFLKGKYPELSLKKSIPKEAPISYKRYESTPVAEKPIFAQTKINTKPISNPSKVKKKNVRFILISLIFFGIIILLFYLLNGSSNRDKKTVVVNEKESINNSPNDIKDTPKMSAKDELSQGEKVLAKQILQRYYDSVASSDLNINSLFDDDVDEYKDINNAELLKDPSFKEIISRIKLSRFDYNSHFTIDMEKLEKQDIKSAYSAWKYNCKSDELLNDKEIDKMVTIEFSFDRNNKLKQLSENYAAEENGGS